VQRKWYKLERCEGIKLSPDLEEKIRVKLRHHSPIFKVCSLKHKNLNQIIKQKCNESEFQQLGLEFYYRQKKNKSQTSVSKTL
jgi:hypothetical protein